MNDIIVKVAGYLLQVNFLYDLFNENFKEIQIDKCINNKNKFIQIIVYVKLVFMKI